VTKTATAIALRSSPSHFRGAERIDVSRRQM
jgi:hypothetical protein